jgi:Trypsin-co-occurring domain 2
MAGLELSEIIRSAAEELRKANEITADLPKVMRFSGCDIELSVTVKAEGGGGLKFWIVDASAKAAKENVSKIKLSFGPIPGKEIDVD